MRVRSRAFRCLGPAGFHRTHIREWGEADLPVLVAVHGLTRNGLDFEPLASRIAAQWRVVAPDVVGRGESDRLPVPTAYDYSTYVADMAAVIASTGADAVDWLGTSMGGIIGMMLASMPGSPIRRLVLNDVGAVVAREGLERIAGYAGSTASWPDFESAYAAIRPNTLPFGPMDDSQRRRFVETGLRRRDDGSYEPNCDPGIAWALRDVPAQDVVLWQIWNAIRCPVLVLRGAESDLLRCETVEEMQARGPGCDVHEVPGVGHTPALMDDETTRVIARFLGG